MTFSLTSGKAGNLVEAQKVPGHYIVVLKDSVSDPVAVAKDIGSKHGLGLGFIYSHALKGFSADIPDAVLNKVKNDKRVSYVEQDQVVQAFAASPQANPNSNGKGSGSSVTQPPQRLPTGVDRIDADLSQTAKIDGVDERVNVNVAIIDTGIDLKHPDLNAVNAKTCVPGTRSANDDNGHGTHVAGIVGAKDNGIGVVGVAPGATLYAVKVLDKRGSGFTSWVICGIDWVTANASTFDITVANMSLGGSGSDDGNCGLINQDAMHQAICNSVNSGVVYTVAAGNSSVDASNQVPAAYDEVITVSAIVDTDGICGAAGGGTSYGSDDSFASFSNYGADVDFAAPGVNILSTYKGQSYATLSGTSMASPHVAGAAALYIANHLGSTPDQVKSGLQSTALLPSTICDHDGHGGYNVIAGRASGPLVYAASP
ncbi:MAG: S8 family serine peptidase [Thaumarchaeota archaeon]|nr:S8 family serine peptidase [Nitrososphaerota archaeon]